MCVCVVPLLAFSEAVNEIGEWLWWAEREFQEEVGGAGGVAAAAVGTDSDAGHAEAARLGPRCSHALAHAV